MSSLFHLAKSKRENIMNVTVQQKEKRLKSSISITAIMPRELTLYFETFESCKMKSFALASNEELTSKIKKALSKPRFKNLLQNQFARSKVKRVAEREFEKSFNGEDGKAKMKLLRDLLYSFNYRELENWIDSLQPNIAINLKRNLIWIEDNSEKIALNKLKKSERGKAKRIKNGGTGRKGAPIKIKAVRDKISIIEGDIAQKHILIAKFKKECDKKVEISQGWKNSLLKDSDRQATVNKHKEECARLTKHENDMIVKKQASLDKLNVIIGQMSK